MSEKPGKRLVCGTQYIMVLLDKCLGYSAATITLLGGTAFLLLSVICFWLAAHKEATGIPLWGPGAILLILGIASLSCGKSMFKNAKKVEPVALVTRHNTRHLPAVESLVRPSDLPPSQQQAELLRAVKPGQETPPAELLRATNEAE